MPVVQAQAAAGILVHYTDMGPLAEEFPLASVRANTVERTTASEGELQHSHLENCKGRAA